MVQSVTSAGQRPVWFMGAIYNGRDDQTPRFLAEGCWENGYKDKYIDDVKSILPGDRIAIKATYTRKKDLPFDNRGQPVSVMAIKATGTVEKNMGDGRHLKVAWTPVDSRREWFFYTNRKTVWKVHHGSGTWPYAADSLIRFAFDDGHQDISRFRNEPYWRERFGDQPVGDERFKWTKFYAEVADKLLAYRNDRGPLIEAIHEIAGRLNQSFPIRDRFENGDVGPMQDICPFTTIGYINRGISDANRQSIAGELANFLDVKEPVPKFNSTSDGIPVLNNLNTWFFSYAKNRKPDDIDALWEIFSYATEFADADDEPDLPAFIRCYDDAMSRRMVGRKLSMGLYWIRAWSYPTLDSHSTRYIREKLKEPIPPDYKPNAEEYLELRERLLERFHDDVYPVHSFPELSWAAYQLARGVDKNEQINNGQSTIDTKLESNGLVGVTYEREPDPLYTIEDIVDDGCFLELPKLRTALGRLESKKNLIFQGPPGTGKTWLAKRLAFALIGRKYEHCVRQFQFHPNLSYEDFVRGYRPEEGGLTLVDGPFFKVIEEARNDPENRYVVVIEEINRGNPAHIFGEMLTLLEADKRSSRDALAVAYPRADDERIYIPPNVYLIGTMNLADRSLALVDFALRRRFTFIDLEPNFGRLWRQWMQEHCDISEDFLRNVERRMVSLNQAITSDQNLGRQFRVGHSYVTAPPNTPIDNPQAWFGEVVETEIGPLLEEYWFDPSDEAKARTQKQNLLRDI